MKLIVSPVYESLVPLLTESEYQSLKESIKQNGLWIPIIINKHGVILDGHHRFRACQELGMSIKYAVREFENDLLEKKFVIETNLKRRQLNDFQKAELGVLLLPIEQELAEQRKIDHAKSNKPIGSNDPKGKSRDSTATTIGMSGTTFDRARTVIEKASDDVKQQLRDGKTTINKEYQQIRKQEKRQVRQEEIKNLQVNLPDTIQLYNMDFQKAPVQTNSVSLIFTDPPYLEKFLYLYKQLGDFASKVLKDGGSLITYVPQAFIPEICAWMKESGLNYHWIISVKHSGPSATIWNKKILVAGKVMLWFTKGKYDGEFVRDFIDSEYQGKADHPWQQSTAESSYYIEFMTIENEIVCDPFLGSGKFGESAKMLKRQFIGCEIDPEHFAVAERLISNGN